MTEEPGRIVVVVANPSIDRLLEVEAIWAGTVHRPDQVVAVAGGKGLNAARAAHALGGSVVAVTILGGHAGAWIVGQLEGLGLAMRAVVVDGETRTCVTVRDRETGQLTEFYEPGIAVPEGTFDELERAVEAELDGGEVRVLAMSGSLPPGAPDDGYARLVRLGDRAGAVTIVDTHGGPLQAALAARPTVVKVNAREASEVTGVAAADADGAVDAAERLRRAGAASVVVTLGRDGALGVEPGGSWRLRSSSAPGRYPVGSGDAFLGGMSVALARGASLVDAAVLGMAAGAANAMVPGAGLLDADTARALTSTVEVVVVA
jgi:1-phosphofructokinase family hexose kinase